MTGEGDRRSQPAAGRAGAGTRRRGWYWLLLLPFVALLGPPLYSHITPTVWGIPFFYWYQAVWLIVTALISTFVYRRTR